jgi:outer membrane protein insertion porin family
MVKSARIALCILGFLFPVLTAYAQQPQQPEEKKQETKIERIDIRGNRRIPEERIRYYINSYPGETYSESGLEFDLRALWKSNFFDDIQIQERDGDVGKIITFIVKEKPIIRALEFVGNSAFSESDILDAFKEHKVGLSIDSRYAPSKVKAAEQILKSLLAQSGKPLGTVHSEIEDMPPSSVRIRFVIEEGPTVQIGQIRFTGNKIFSDSELKKALELTKEHGLRTMFKPTDKYHPEKLQMDIGMNLEKFYKSHGYMTVQVGNPVVRILEGPRGPIPFIRKSKQQFYIEIPVDAGDQFRIKNLEFKNCSPLNCDRLVQAFGLKNGDVVNFSRIQDTLENIKNLYSDLGYINWSYIPEEDVDQEAKLYSLTFDFDTGNQFFVNRINFQGNSKTRDKVIRREFLIQEGRIFSHTALERSVLRLNQLGIFEEVKDEDYEVLPDEKTGKVDINVKVKEKSQRSIGFTGGVSGISGSYIGLNYSDNNFMGRGETVALDFQGGTRTTLYSISFTEPYLFDSPWNMQASLFKRRYRYDTYSLYGLTDYTTGDSLELYTKNTSGTSLAFSRRLGRSLWTAGASYAFQKISISDIDTALGANYIQQLIGFTSYDDVILSELTPMLRYNSTNAYFNPSRGTSLYLSVGISGGILGGDYNLFQPTVELRHFFPDRWLSHGHNVFGFHLLGQYIQSYNSSSVPFYERFYMGGENSIRGFNIRQIAPYILILTPAFDQNGHPIIDPQTGLALQRPNLTPVGGDTAAIFNFEYRIPIAGPLSVAAFYDMGVVRITRKESLGDFGASTVDIIDSINNKIRGSTGVEIQFVLPVVSTPFRLIFAYNPQRLNEKINVSGIPIQFNEPDRDVKFTIGRSF